LKRIIDDQHARLVGVEQNLQKVEDKQLRLEERIDRATQVHNLLEQRLQRLRNLPGAHKKPLSRAEREFKSELGNEFLSIVNALMKFFERNSCNYMNSLAINFIPYIIKSIMISLL
jgi:hypothetical protein